MDNNSCLHLAEELTITNINTSHEHLVGNWEAIYNAADSIWIYGGISLAIIGIIGHVTSIGVILSSRSFRTSSGVLIIALSLAGICALCTGLVRQIILNVSEFTIDIELYL